MLIAPALSQVNNVYFTPLVVAAISAAVLASLTSIPIAFAGGLGLGVLQQILSIYLPTNSILASNLRPSLPFVVLFLILIFSPALRNRRELADPLAGVAPPPRSRSSPERSRELTIGTARLVDGRARPARLLHLLPRQLSWVQATEQATIYAIIFCSIVVITGMAGQISLCQATFAGIGGFVTFQLSTAQGMSVLRRDRDRRGRRCGCRCDARADACFAALLGTPRMGAGRSRRRTTSGEPSAATCPAPLSSRRRSRPRGAPPASPTSCRCVQAGNPLS